MIKQYSDELIDKIHKQREEILTAFIAKYGCEPDDAVQMILSDANGIYFYVQKKQIFNSREQTGKVNTP